MENQDTYFSDLKQDAKAYINDRILLVKLRTVRTAAATSGKVTVAVVILFLSFFFLLFLGLTLGFWLSVALNSAVGAFAIVLAFYVAIVALVMALRKKLIAGWITKKMIANVLGDRIQSDINASSET